MIASAAFFHLLRGEQHSLDLDVVPGLSLPFLQPRVSDKTVI
jgi:N6-L-threonylcarbamoyladenine synthase